MSQPEAFSRILIDKALEFSGWHLLNSQQIQFEQHTETGRADYLLKDSFGRVLCVLEAKREGLDPYDAKSRPAVTLNNSALRLSFCPMDVNIGFGTMSGRTSVMPTASSGCLRVTISNEPGLRIFSRRVPFKGKSSHPSISASSNTT